MTIGGTLIVASANEYKNFEVKFARNTEVTNYTQRSMGQKGDIRAVIKNGKTGYAEKIYNNGTRSDELGTLDLNTKRYAIFDALRKLDGNANDISEKDLARANSLIGKNGVKSVQRNTDAGITTIVCDDGAVLQFDVETDKEKAIREKQEAQAADKRKKAQTARHQEELRKKAELHEACKSDLQKAWEFFVGLFH